MKESYYILIIIAILIVGWLFVRFVVGENEENWIKDSRGIYIKHGNPNNIPIYVSEQEDAINCALDLYDEKKVQEMQFSSQCLGTCSDYAIDVVNIPRNSEDNLAENQCSDFKQRKTSYFIELDEDENIVRIV